MNISIILCTYNSDTYLDQQLKSFTTQNESADSIELIVSDDSSSQDNVYARVDSLDKLEAFSTRVVSGPKTGSACQNFLSALKLDCEGDWVFLSDQDDIWPDNKLSKYCSVMSKLDNSIPQVIFSDASLIDENGVEVHKSFYRYENLNVSILRTDDILFENCVQGATICLNREMLNLIRESLDGEDISSILMHDWWIAILVRYYGNWTYIDEALLMYRQHENNAVGARGYSHILVKFIRSPKDSLCKLLALKKQLNLWTKVSKKLRGRSSYHSVKMSLNNLSLLKLVLIKFLL